MKNCLRSVAILSVTLCTFETAFAQSQSCPLYPMGYQGSFVTYYALRPTNCSGPHMFAGPPGLTSNCSTGVGCVASLVLEKKQRRVESEIKDEAKDDPNLIVKVSDIEVGEGTVAAPWVTKIHTKKVWFVLSPGSDPIYVNLYRLKCKPANYDFPGASDDVRDLLRKQPEKFFHFGHEVEPENAEDYIEIDSDAVEPIQPGFHYRITKGHEYSVLIRKR